MKSKIAIITSGHFLFDERIYWKFGLTLFGNGYDVYIISSTEDNKLSVNGINIIGFPGNNLTKKEKISRLLKELLYISPNFIICCEPITILPSYIFKKRHNNNCKIICDITEWYPENITSKKTGLKKFLAFIFLTLFNIILNNLSDALIIGEVTKQRRYDIISPFKKKIIIGYYPVLRFFAYSPPEFDGKNLTLCYAGLVSFQRGIITLVEIAELLSEKFKNINIKVKIIGKFQSSVEEKEFDDIVTKSTNITIEKSGWTEYNNISNLIKEVDICFDLRDRNFIYNNSLPIKIFEYMAAGKPFIFSDIKPIRTELGEINCGFLVDPVDKKEIALKVEEFILNPGLLKLHAKNGRAIIENGKNWEKESEKLISFLEQLAKFK
jgi:glycosyltransferase involved in cell wall biosynthesis